MKQYLSRILRARYSSGKAQPETDKPGVRKRNVIDLALENYNKEQKALSSSSKQEQQVELDPDFEKYAIDAMNAFIFAGKLENN